MIVEWWRRIGPSFLHFQAVDWSARITGKSWENTNTANAVHDENAAAPLLITVTPRHSGGYSTSKPLFISIATIPTGSSLKSTQVRPGISLLTPKSLLQFLTPRKDSFFFATPLWSGEGCEIRSSGANVSYVIPFHVYLSGIGPAMCGACKEWLQRACSVGT